MGLRSIAEQDWIIDRPDWDEHVLEKRDVLRDHYDEVFAALPEANAGSVELLAVLVEHCERYLSLRIEIVRSGQGGGAGSGAAVAAIDRGSGIRTDFADLHPLDAAARIVPDDLTIQVRDEHEWLLVGASVAFPSRWVLAEKVGLGLDAVHDPVPGYDEALRPAMTGTFDKLRVDRIVERVNWTIPDDPTLFQPVPPGRRRQAPAATAAWADGAAMSPADVVAGLWLRIERQTVRLLPVSRAAVFTIATFVEPLTSFADDPEALAALAQTLPTVPAPNLAYKGISAAAPGITQWAQDRLAALGS